MTFQRNLGFGRDGRGGTIADSTVGSFPNPNALRNTGVQGSPPTPPAPLPIVTVATTSELLTDTAQYIFKGALDDTITCNIVSIVDQDEVESGTSANIAKPPHLRKREIDTDGEENSQGEIITYAPDELLNLQGTRKREFESNGGTVTLFEKIDPPYIANELIFAASVQASGVPGIRFQDLNLAARRWINIFPLYRYFVITSFNRDTLECQEWDFATSAQKLGPDGLVLDAVQVAKTHDVRGTSWSKDVSLEEGGVGDTQTPDGARYTTVGATDETGPHIERAGFRDEPFPADDTDEQQEITPPWFDASEGVWATIIKAVRIDTGTGVFFESVQTIWQDTNAGGHAFAEKFA